MREEAALWKAQAGLWKFVAVETLESVTLGKHLRANGLPLVLLRRSELKAKEAWHLHLERCRHRLQEKQLSKQPDIYLPTRSQVQWMEVSSIG